MYQSWLDTFSSKRISNEFHFQGTDLSKSERPSWAPVEHWSSESIHVWERFTKLDDNRLKQSRASYQSSAVRRLQAPRIFPRAEVLELLSWLCSSNVWSPKCLSLRCGFPIARLFPDCETLNCNLPKPLTICESSFNIFWKKGETGGTWKE